MSEQIFTDELELRGDSDVLWDVLDAYGERVGRLHYDEETREYTPQLVKDGGAGEMLASDRVKRIALDALCHAVNTERADAIREEEAALAHRAAESRKPSAGSDR